MEDKFWEVIYSLSPKQLEEAVQAFIAEQKLVEEFLTWIEKWKSLEGIE